MTPEGHGERIAVLESEMSAIRNQNADIIASLSRVEHEMTRYKGFLGGIAFLVSGAAAILVFLKGWLFAR